MKSEEYRRVKEESRQQLQYAAFTSYSRELQLALKKESSRKTERPLVASCQIQIFSFLFFEGENSSKMVRFLCFKTGRGSIDDLKTK